MKLGVACAYPEPRLGLVGDPDGGAVPDRAPRELADRILALT